MNIILVRHGDVANADHKFHGISNEPLSSKGREEVYRTVKDLKPFNPSMIYYCPTQRTSDTAKILSNELGIARKKSDALLPLNLGNFVGKPIDTFLKSVRHYLANPEEKIPGGQSVNDWAAHYLPFFEKYFRNKSNNTIIFVTHGRNILLTKAYIESGELAPNFDKSELINNTETTEHGGYALARMPDHFEIIDSKSVIGGRS
jgi:broad specificity phosphatase PhoE